MSDNEHPNSSSECGPVSRPSVSQTEFAAILAGTRQCPTMLEIERVAAADGGDARVSFVRTHVSTCPECLEIVAALNLISDAAKKATTRVLAEMPGHR